jgi:glycerate kinase
MGTLIVALDKFKGSLDAARAGAALGRGLRSGRPDLPVRLCPVADGGEGTLDALAAAGFTRVPVTATGPTGAPVRTGYVARGDVAVVELADVSGLGRLPGRPSPATALAATTAGTGQVVAAALDAGHRTVVLGLGGSASTDGGAGLVGTLGARLVDDRGRDLAPGGAALAGLDRIDLTDLHPRLRSGAAELVVACDVDNPLLGPAGAAAVYGPQKGAGPAQVAQLDAALARWAELLSAAAGVRVADVPGAGAAGGVGFAALALGGRMRGGIELILSLTGLAERLPGARLVITGEGSLDAQTLRGKAPAGVAAAARRAGVPVVAVAGRNLLRPDQLAAAGITAAYALTDLEPDPARSMRDAAGLLERTGRRIAREVLGTVAASA